MKLFLSVLLILTTSLMAHADPEKKLSVDEFLLKMERKELTLKRDPWMPNVPEPNRPQLMELFKKLNPNFREGYWFIPNIKTNRYVYTVFYDWANQKCLIRIEGWNPSKKEYIRSEIDPVGTKVDKKYCETAYEVKIN